MKSIDDAWEWYRKAREGAFLLVALGRNWEKLSSPQSPLLPGRLGHIEADTLAELGAVVLAPLDDLGVLVLFSVFEVEVRSSVLAALTPDLDAPRHPVAESAAGELLEDVAEGSFFRLSNAFKGTGDKFLIEHVNQVRRYRNWVAHGRRGDEPDRVDPKTAYDRLTRFLRMIGLRPASPIENDESPPVGK